MWTEALIAGVERVRSLGTAHALGNVTAVALYGGSFLARRRGRRDLGARLATLGAAVVTGSGFIAGHLAYRKGVGVDETVFRPRLDDWTPVLEDRELDQAQPRRETAGGTDILLYRRGDRVLALADRCSHRGARCTRAGSSTGRSPARGTRAPSASTTARSSRARPPRRSPATRSACATAPSRSASRVSPSRSGSSSNDAGCPTPVEPLPCGGRRGRRCIAPTRYALTMAQSRYIVTPAV